MLDMFGLGLHSFILAMINIGTIIIGFRLNKLLSNAIAIQTPLSGVFSLLLFTGLALSINAFHIKGLVLKRSQDFLRVYGLAFLWSPLIFFTCHRIIWGYSVSARDIMSLWLFQLVVNSLILKACALIISAFPGFVLKEAPMQRVKSFVFAVLLVAMSGTLTLLLAGVLLQKYYDPPAIESGWRSSVSPLEKNQLGFRGQMIDYAEDDFVILLVGDSQVEAKACAYSWMPERRLEFHLNSLGNKTKVFTLGAGGYGQDQQLLVLEEYYEIYRADMVLLLQTPDNDVWNNMFPTHWPENGTPKPTFWLEDEELHGPSEVMGARIRRSSVTLLDVLLSTITPLKRDEQWERYLPEAYVPMSTYDGRVNASWQQRWEKNIGQMRHEDLQNEKSHFILHLSPRSQRTEYGLKLTRRLLQAIQALVATHSGRFYLLNIIGELESERSEEIVYVLNQKYYRTSAQQHRANLDYITQEFPSFAIPVTIQNAVVGPEDSHMNQHAVDQVMKDLAGEISNNVTLKKGEFHEK